MKLLKKSCYLAGIFCLFSLISCGGSMPAVCYVPGNSSSECLPQPITQNTPSPLINNTVGTRFDHWSYTHHGDSISGVWIVIESPPSASGISYPYPNYDIVRKRYNCRIILEDAEHQLYTSDCPLFNDFSEYITYDTNNDKLYVEHNTVTELPVLPPELDPEQREITVTDTTYIEIYKFSSGRMEGEIAKSRTRQEDDNLPTTVPVGHSTFLHMVRIADDYESLGQLTLRQLVLPDDPDWSSQLPTAGYLPDHTQVVQDSISLSAGTSLPINRFYEYHGFYNQWELQLFNGNNPVLDASGQHRQLPNEDDQYVYVGAGSPLMGINGSEPVSQRGALIGNGVIQYLEWLQNDAEKIQLRFFYNDASPTTWDDVKYVEADISWSD